MRKARRGGWVAYQDGSGEIWVRREESWGAWWRKVIGRPKEEEELLVDDGVEERSKWVWWNLFVKKRLVRLRSEDTRPLLS